MSRAIPCSRPLLAQVHGRIATVIDNRHGGHWDALAADDEEDVYDARFASIHEKRGGDAGASSENAIARATALVQFTEELAGAQRWHIAAVILATCVSALRRPVEQEGRAELANGLATALNNHGSALQALGRLAEAEACQRENVAICRRLVEQEGRAELANGLAIALAHLGRVLRDQRRLAEAAGNLGESIVILERAIENRGPAWLTERLEAARRDHEQILQAMSATDEAR
jgi:tetratricopeptide (TPR) repeat protein